MVDDDLKLQDTSMADVNISTSASMSGCCRNKLFYFLHGEQFTEVTQIN